MKIKIILMAIFSFFGFAFKPTTKTIHDFKVTDIEGNEFDMAQLKGKKVMIVNTASECGYTPQYKELQELYLKYKDKNFVIIGFPANDFGAQEPGSNIEIKSFCTKNYGVTFPMMSKITVKGENMAPIYKWLQNKSDNGVEDAIVKWNFFKFLIDENGNWVRALKSGINPMSQEITQWIEGKS